MPISSANIKSTLGFRVDDEAADVDDSEVKSIAPQIMAVDAIVNFIERWFFIALPFTGIGSSTVLKFSKKMNPKFL